MDINITSENDLMIKTYTGKLLETDRDILIANEMYLEEESGFWTLYFSAHEDCDLSVSIISDADRPLALATVGNIFNDQFQTLYHENDNLFFVDLGYLSVFVSEDHRGKNLSRLAIKHLVSEFNSHVENWPKVTNKDNTIYFAESQNPKMRDICLLENPKLVVYSWDYIDHYSWSNCSHKSDTNFIDVLFNQYQKQNGESTWFERAMQTIF